MTAHAKLSTPSLTAHLTSPAVHYSREYAGCEMSQTGNEGMEGGTQDLSPQTLVLNHQPSDDAAAAGRGSDDFASDELNFPTALTWMRPLELIRWCCC